MLSLWRRSRPWVRTVAVVPLVGVAGTGVYWFGFRDDPASAATAGPTTTAVAASLSTIEQSVQASGTLTPAVQEDVAFAVSGTVTAVDVAVGDTVAAGQTLATVDTLQLEADLLAARADLASAQASLSDAQDAADGTDASDAQVAAAQAKVEVAQAAVAAAEADVASATLTAPVAGVLTTVDVAVGDAVTGTSGSSGTSGSTSGSAVGAASGAGSGSSGGAGGSTTATSTSQFVIVGTGAWQVDVTVDESDVALVAVGDQAEITVDGADEPVYGTVGEIGLLSTSTGGVAAYPVTVDVTGTPDGLHDGEAADVAIVYERRTDVLTVPAAAVQTVDGETVVTQQDADGGTVTTPVTTGETSGSLVEVVDGLAEGDEVLVTTFQPGAGRAGTDGTQDGTQDGTGQGSVPAGGQLPDFSGGVPGGVPGSAPGGSDD